MGAVDTPDTGAKHKKGKRRKPKRIGIEINLPPDPNQKVEIAESNVMTLRVVAPQDSTRGDVRAFWRIAKDPFQEVDVEKLQPIFATEAKRNSKLVVLVKIDRKAKYRYMVDIIDQLQFAELNRFSLAPLLPEEKKEVESL